MPLRAIPSSLLAVLMPHCQRSKGKKQLLHNTYYVILFIK